MAAITIPTETTPPIRATRVVIGSGRVQLWFEGAPCFTVQMAYSPAGPWYDVGDGVEGQPVDIAIHDQGSDRHYQAVWRECPEPETE